MRQHDAGYFARLLVEPSTLEPLRLEGLDLITQSGAHVPIVAGVPVFGRTQLSTSQLAELAFDRRCLADLRQGLPWAGVPESSYAWSRPWLDVLDLDDPGSRLVCLGGSFADDLPKVPALNKFNIDHLADVYATLAAPEVASQDTTFVSCPAETLPFATGTVDAVYSRNAIDHFDNPLLVLEEVHRVLKPTGMFLFACYYDSTFLDAAETKVVDRDFVDRYVAALFAEEHRQLEPAPSQVVVGPSPTQWIQYAGRPKPGGRLPIDEETVEWSARLANSFQQALAERVGDSPDQARQLFADTLTGPPVVPTDAHRQVFAALQLMAMSDDNALRAAAQTIRDHGLTADWRQVADLVLGLYGWSLDDVPPPVDERPVQCPQLDEWQWYAALSLSARVLSHPEAAEILRDTAIRKSPRAADWIDASILSTRPTGH